MFPIIMIYQELLESLMKCQNDPSDTPTLCYCDIVLPSHCVTVSFLPGEARWGGVSDVGSTGWIPECEVWGGEGQDKGNCGGRVARLVEDFFRTREFTIEWDGKVRGKGKTNLGASQGSPLSPDLSYHHGADPGGDGREHGTDGWDGCG